MKQLLADRVRGGDVALDFAQRAPLLDGFSDWDWRLESDGASRDADHVRLVSAQVGDPVAIVPPPTLAAPRQLVARVLDAQLWSSRFCPPSSVENSPSASQIPERARHRRRRASPRAPGSTGSMSRARCGRQPQRRGRDRDPPYDLFQGKNMHSVLAFSQKRPPDA